MRGLIKACQDGDVNVVKSFWTPGVRCRALQSSYTPPRILNALLDTSPSPILPPQIKAKLSSLGRDDTCHPLLNACHHVHPGVVAFLLGEGVSPLQRGTVHPYTGDNMTVSQMKGGWQSGAHEAWR